MNEKKISYEPPVLVKIGDAAEVIRGVCSCGYDGDTMFMTSTDEFQSELGLNG
jgi:hypothetical protein